LGGRERNRPGSRWESIVPFGRRITILARCRATTELRRMGHVGEKCSDTV